MSKNVHVGQRLQGRTASYIVVANYSDCVFVVRIESSGNVHVVNGRVNTMNFEHHEMEEFLSK